MFLATEHYMGEEYFLHKCSHKCSKPLGILAQQKFLHVVTNGPVYQRKVFLRIGYHWAVTFTIPSSF